MTSKVFGFPQNISTNLAYDKYQGLLAYGTNYNMIKIISLKGYEYEIYEAHQSGIKRLEFVPNQGILISADDKNIIRQWNLRDLRSPPFECQIQEKGSQVVTCIHTAQFLTNEPDNHGFVFIGLSNGNIYTYDVEIGALSSLVIRYKILFPDKSSDLVIDMKTNPQHMHRLLIAYQNTAIVMYSLNKNRDIQRIHFSMYDNDRGKALAIEFIPPNHEMFVVGYSSGCLCLYKTESKSHKPSKVIDIKMNNIYDMQLNIVERGTFYQVISCQYSYEIGATFGNRGSPMQTDVLILSGKNYESQIKISQIMKQSSLEEEIETSVSALFMLQAKYQTLEKMSFKLKEEESKYDIKGIEIVDFIKDKNRSLNIYGASLLLILTKSFKFQFFNIDSLFKEQDSSPQSQIVSFDKIYTHQREILCSQIIPIQSSKEMAQLLCFVEFRSIYIKKQLQQIFQTDQLAQNYLHEKMKKKIPKEFNSDLELQCSLNYSQGLESFLQTPLLVLITVDKSNTVKIYGIYSEQCELITQIPLKLENQEDFVVSMFFYLKAKLLIITTAAGQNFVITSINNLQTRILKDQRSIPDTEADVGRVTCLSASNSAGDLLFIGYKNSHYTVFDHEKKKIKTVRVDSKTSKDYKFVQIEDLPSQIEDSKTHVFYALTSQNLYCISKKDQSTIKASYFKKVTSKMPKLKRFGYMIVKEKFSMLLMIQDNIFQMLDTFSLQPFASFQIPIFYKFQDYRFINNLIYGIGKDNFLIYELDQEIKKQSNESIFDQYSGMFEEIRQNMIQPEIIFKKPTGMGKIFKKYITIKGALDKNASNNGGQLQMRPSQSKRGRKSTFQDEDDEESKEEMKDDKKRSRTPNSQLGQINNQMQQNLSQMKENSQMIDNIEKKGEMLNQESTNFRSMAQALNQKKKSIF
ncbi:syntaxin-binding protein 5-like [Stylonychia lemnae]|uniref:Syntaxin-binding protein 5-like n=1 Tax=Stylonychia lemnae TaxID=5949 RepID=A0A077ZZE9_STYLE|nr:syntaxin-binding protein 5-like [Stylonychia lemnae]|eukprot:CDW73878.1 syntaxin-binding protein 5-like [Stylonychia lemnae]